MVDFLLYSALAIFLYMTIIFGIALVKKDNSIADIAWGFGFILVAALTLFLEKGLTARQVVIAVLVFVWGTRLAVHITARNKGRGEDFRYAEWRRKWGKSFVLRTYLQVFILQGFFLLVIAYPIILVHYSREEGITVLDIIGTLIWTIGFIFEAAGDFQLLQFKRDPMNKGKIMNRGLWKFTRHPNYFGESVMWWGIFLIALSAKNGWTALVSPVLMTFLLLRVSGVVLLEKKYAGNKDYAEYARKTSAFIPWFPKKGEGKK